MKSNKVIFLFNETLYSTGVKKESLLFESSKSFSKGGVHLFLKEVQTSPKSIQSVIGRRSKVSGRHKKISVHKKFRINF